MKWNLVGCTDVEKRVGYVWLEFERLDESGATQRITAGIGMRAHRAQADVPRWYFIARNRTIGADLALLRGRDPIGKAELAAALGDDGEVLDSQRDYRARLNDLLFGFGGEEQYQTMLRLMRDLRRPHLSKTLDPDRVAKQLTAGLPEVDEGLMRRLAGGLEQLETLERGLERLRDVRERVRRFHQRTYSAYARAAVRERAEALRQAQTAVENAAEQLRATRAELDAERERAERATAERDAAEAELARLSAEEHGLISSEGWSSVAEVEGLREHAATQSRAATAAREQANSAAGSASMLEAELITAQAAAAERRERATAELDLVVALAARAGVARRVQMLAEQLRAGTLTAETWSPLLRDLASDWRDVLHRHRELLRDSQRAAAAAERARGDERDASARVEAALARKAACEQQLEDARAALTAAFANWRAELAELELDDDTTTAALELALAGQPAAPALTPVVERARRTAADERSALVASRRAAAEAVAATETEIERLAASHDDGPPPPAWTRADRGGREGAPLWRLIDFSDGVPAERRCGLEAALEGAGLLDAWVTPSGQLEDPTLADVVLTGGQPAAHASLLQALVPVPDQAVGEAVVTGLLRGVGLGEHDDRSLDRLRRAIRARSAGRSGQQDPSRAHWRGGARSAPRGSDRRAARADRVARSGDRYS